MLAKHSELAREKMWSRIHLIPLLQAEEDRDLVRRHWADKAREKELMGGEMKVYHSDRYVLLFHSDRFFVGGKRFGAGEARLLYEYGDSSSGN